MNYIKSKLTLFLSFYLTAPLALAEYKKPNMISSSTQDTEKGNQATELLTSTIAEWTIYAALVAFFIGLFMCIPFVGKKEQGIAGMKGAFVVILIVALIDGVVLPLLNKLL